MAVERVRVRIWSTVPIYVIEPREARTANGLLPERLGAYNGAARVWWPGVDEDSEPSWHPLIYDSTGFYGEGALERLATEFALRSAERVDLGAREQAALRLRSVPRPATAAASDGEPAPVSVLASRKDLRRLTTDLRRRDREAPVVVLTFREGEEEPGFPPTAIRQVLDPRISIYVLGTQDLCRRLAQALGQQLAVDGGDARIFWPGVSQDSDPAEHPLIAAHIDADRRSPAERLAEALELSRPGVSGHVAAMQERLQAAEQRAADTLSQLRDSRTDCREAITRAETLEASLAVAEQQLAALQLAGLDHAELELVATMDRDARMHRLIARAWLGALPSAVDRQEFPPGGYVFGARFIESVEELTGTPLERIAWACAMVASGRAKGMPGLEPHHLRASGAGSAGQLIRADGAKAWICRLLGEGASRLQYWVTADGVTEFATVGTHDAIGRL
ncbi:MAG: hypothetical protein H0X28_09060 [Solirubrobacterales bacterium]|nr:hypothetical protein [Solirubrobacterales bacterium]